MQSSSIRVGEVLAFAGDRFIEERWGHVEITFTGTFAHAGGTVEAAATQLAERMDGGIIETTFGPFAVPFIQSGNATGTFRGKVYATNRQFDGRAEQQDESSWVDVELTVLPSIVVVEFEPKLQQIEIEPLDAIAEMPYQLSIEAVGFTLASIEYLLGEGALIDGRDVDMVIHDAAGATDTLGDRELFTFAAPPSGSQDFVVPIVIRAASENGESFSLGLNARVH
jgi:hypothetical protein